MVQLDTHVVDAQTAQRGQQMFDRLDRGFVDHKTGLQLLAGAEVGDVRGYLQA